MRPCDHGTQDLCVAMTYQEFLKQLDKAEMSIKEFAHLIKRTPNALTNYASKGEVPAHIAIIATLCAHMHLAGYDYRGVIAGIDFAGMKPREDGVKGFRGNRTDAISDEIFDGGQFTDKDDA